MVPGRTPPQVVTRNQGPACPGTHWHGEEAALPGSQVLSASRHLVHGSVNEVEVAAVLCPRVFQMECGCPSTLAFFTELPHTLNDPHIALNTAEENFLFGFCLLSKRIIS